MSDESVWGKVRVTNQRQQPVELHAGGRVTVLAPSATIELELDATSGAQIAVLARRGLIVVQKIAARVPPPAALPLSAPPLATASEGKNMTSGKRPVTVQNPARPGASADKRSKSKG